VQLTADRPSQYERALALLPLLERKVASNEAQIQARHDRGPEGAAEVLRGEAPGLMVDLRAATDGLQSEERRELLRRQAENEANERRLSWVLLIGAGLSIGLVGIAFSLVRRAQRELERANDDLEARVQRRTAELVDTAARVRASESRLRFLADTMPQLVWTARPDGTIESLNRGYLDYLETEDEAAGIAALQDVVHPDDRPASEAAWTRMFREGHSAGGELRLRRGDGEYRWHLWRAHPERDADGKIIRWVGTSTDIHDHKMAEERLEQRVAERTAELATSEERFRHAFYFSGIGMALVALDGRWIRVNKALCDIVGYTEVGLLQKTFQDITHPEDLAADLALVRELLAGERRAYQMEKRYFHCDGHTVWIRLTVSLVRDPAGAPVHFVSQIEDITERKHLEVSLAQARDQALEASRLKSEFLATMSHEIRTPMNGVIGMTALLRDTPLTETQSDYVRTIESSGESLLTIINDILDYSKIEAGRIDLEVTSFDLRQLIEDALDLFGAAAREKNIELVYLLGAGVPTHVAGDATRLRQVLVNLLSNALKFTERGEIVVTVDATPSGAKHVLRFAVKDTGIGISPTGMERLFKSFSQVDASTTRRFGGTGLGLAISRRLAELMGGTMWAESIEREGSTFHFTVVVEAQPHLVRHNLQTRQPDLEGRTLLVVDDNATNRRVVTGLARAWGMHVREAASGHVALAALAAESQCDVAVVDMQMPEMDGEQLGAAIRAQPASEKLPLILLTSLGRRKAAPGFAQTLSKPIKPEALFAAIRACVRPDLAAERRTAPSEPVHDAMLAQRCPLRLLVAEDNAVNQRVAALLLLRLGYRTTMVANGLEVLSAIELADYDAILMDVEMPELDGCEATRRIRQQRGSPGRPWIIALTAGAMEGDRERALEAGMNDFLTKPVRSEALSEALRRAHAALAAAGSNPPMRL
jgi:two-component system, sensor histidine kinase and response regulator